MKKLITSMLLAVIAFAPAALAKKTKTTSPSTQSDKEQKDRARNFENGKNLDKDKTEGKVDKIVGDVNELDRIIKEREAADEPAGKKKKSRTTQPTTQPATQPAKGKGVK